MSLCVRVNNPPKVLPFGSHSPLIPIDIPRGSESSEFIDRGWSAPERLASVGAKDVTPGMNITFKFIVELLVLC